MKTCTISDCSGTYDSKGLCKKHYDAKRRFGSATAKSKRHNMTGSREHNSWLGMRQRCYYSKHKDYKYYGGKGIAVCEEWRHSFINFYEDMGKRPIGTTLDRINPELGYSPDNCRWATYSEQSSNRASWSSTGHKYIYKSGSKFQLCIDGQYLGIFDKLENAIIQKVAEQTVEHQTVKNQE